MTKKILLFIFILSSLAVAQLQAQTTYEHPSDGKKWEYTVTGTEATIIGVYNIDGSSVSGELKIPAKVGTSPEYDVTAIGDNAFENLTGVTAVSVPEKVKTIGKEAFHGCFSLAGKLDLPNVTSIGDQAFYICSSLNEVSLPKVQHIGNEAFYQCTALSGKLDLPNVTNIGDQAFIGCVNLTELSSPKVTDIGAKAFYECSALGGNLNLPNAQNIGEYAFNMCTEITGLEIPKIVNIGDAAFALTGLTGKLSLPKTLTVMGQAAFGLCANLSAIAFESGTDLSGITGGMHFYGCDNLQYIDMAGVTAFPAYATETTRHDVSLFQDLQPYTMIYLPATAPAATLGEENFVVGGNCDRFIVYDKHANYQMGDAGCSYPIQHPFTAQTAEYHNREISGAACQTICLPYKSTLPRGMRAYKLVSKTTDGTKMQFEAVGSGDGVFQLEANTPYLIRIINGSSYVSNYFASYNISVDATPANLEVALADGQTFFGGTIATIDNATASSNNLYNLSNNTWSRITTTNPTDVVLPFRAYLRTTGSASAASFAIVLEDSPTTKIDNANATELTEAELRSGKHEFYTLDGRRAADNYDSLKSGEIYVVNGQKIYKF